MSSIFELGREMSSLLSDMRGDLRLAWRSEPGQRAFVLSLLFVFAASAAFFLLRMEYVLGHPSIDMCLMGSDSKIYVGELTAPFSKSLYGLLKFHGVRRHPALVFVAIGLVLPLHLAGLSALQAAIAALALLIGVGASALFVFFRRNGCGNGLAMTGAALSLAMFSPLTVLSAIDVYGFVYASACLCLLLCTEIARHASRFPRASAWAAGLVAGAIAWANLPLASYILFYSGPVWLREPWRRRSPLPLILPPLLAIAIGIVPLALGDLLVGHLVQGIDKWASFGHFTNGQVLANYPVAALLASIANPLGVVRNIYGASDYAGIWSAIPQLPALVTVWALALFAAWRLGRSAQGVAILAAALVIAASLLIFYIYFDPWEATLFATQWCLLIAVVVVLGVRNLRIAPLLVGAAVILLLTVNVTAIYFPEGVTCQPTQFLPDDVNS